MHRRGRDRDEFAGWQQDRRQSLAIAAAGIQPNGVTLHLHAAYCVVAKDDELWSVPRGSTERKEEEWCVLERICSAAAEVHGSCLSCRCSSKLQHGHCSSSFGTHCRPSPQLRPGRAAVRVRRGAAVRENAAHVHQVIGEVRFWAAARPATTPDQQAKPAGPYATPPQRAEVGTILTAIHVYFVYLYNRQLPSDGLSPFEAASTVSLLCNSQPSGAFVSVVFQARLEASVDDQHAVLRQPQPAYERTSAKGAGIRASSQSTNAALTKMLAGQRLRLDGRWVSKMTAACFGRCDSRNEL